MQRLTEAFGPPQQRDHGLRWVIATDGGLHAPVSLVLPPAQAGALDIWAFAPVLGRPGIRGFKVKTAEDLDELIAWIRAAARRPVPQGGA